MSSSMETCSRSSAPSCSPGLPNWSVVFAALSDSASVPSVSVAASPSLSRLIEEQKSWADEPVGVPSFLTSMSSDDPELRVYASYSYFRERFPKEGGCHPKNSERILHHQDSNPRPCGCKPRS